jgi:hypothetical protein
MIRHNKRKNIGIIFEALSQSLINEIYNKDKDKIKSILNIIKKHFSNKSELLKELKLFNTILYNQFNEWQTANRLLEETLKATSSLNKNKLAAEKFNLLKDIFKIYEDKQFFDKEITNYKLYASIYQLMENRRDKKNLEIADKVKLEELVIYHLLDNKESNRLNKFVRILEEQTIDTEEENISDLVYNIAIRKFNTRYQESLNKEQQSILKEYINISKDKINDFIIKNKNKIETKLYYALKNINSKELSEKIYESMTKLDNIFNLKNNDKKIEMLMTYNQLLEELTNYKITK